MKGEGVHAGHLARCSTLWKACLNMCLALIRESLRIVIISKNQVVFMIYDAICTVKQSKLSRYTAMCGEGCLERGGVFRIQIWHVFKCIHFASAHLS